MFTIKNSCFKLFVLNLLSISQKKDKPALSENVLLPLLSFAELEGLELRYSHVYRALIRVIWAYE